MALTNDENYFDPTPKLKTSPIPISFIPFNNERHRCNNCGNKYSVALLYKQKYCKKCLSSYVKNITDNNTYLDVQISTNNSQCIEHKETRNTDFCTNNIQEWCKHCSEISYFKNFYDDISTTNKYIFKAEDCKLCGKLIYQISSKFKMCSHCYLLSYEWVESTLTKKSIPILYLPWWDASNKSRICNHPLKFISDCQKWCSNCFMIYTGCKYCLTTNIIFGVTVQSQCKKCKRILSIDIDIMKDITNITSGNRDIDEFLVSTRTNIGSHNQIVDYMNNIDKNSNPLNIYGFIENKLKNINSKRIMEWIPYSQITNIEKIARGGFGIIYKAIWLNKTDVAVKRFLDGKYLLNELKALHQCYDMTFIIKYYGITQDPETKDYMLIMEYAGGGNLHSYLNKYFTNIKWNTKLAILNQISDGLKTIHNENFIHRDFHSGNVLSLKNRYNKWVIGDLGLSQPVNNPLNDEVYGVIPYIAPEIFKGAGFSKETDIYSLGMIMWEFTTGCKPFDNVDHDHDLILKIIDGKRPEITNDTPECFAELMKICWESDPLKRPSITEIKKTLDDWYKNGGDIFYQAEKKRLELIRLKKLGPIFTEKSCSGAIYAGRPLSSLISQSSLIYSSSNVTQEYITKEYKFDIRSNSQRPISESSKSLSINQEYISNELDFDTDTNTQRMSSTNINSTAQNLLNTRQSNAIYTSRSLSALINTSKNKILKN